MAVNLQHAKKLVRKTLKLNLKQMTANERERESQMVIQGLLESKHFQESQRISGTYYQAFVNGFVNRKGQFLEEF